MSSLVQSGRPKPCCLARDPLGPFGLPSLAPCPLAHAGAEKQIRRHTPKEREAVSFTRGLPYLQVILLEVPPWFLW